MVRRLILMPFKIARWGVRQVLQRGQGQSPPETRAPSPPPPPPPSPEPSGRTPPGIDPRSVQTSPEEIFDLQGKGVKVVFVDVREAGECASGIIADALWIPLGQLEKRKTELTQEDEIVLYCASGMRSTQAALLLRERGYGKAKSLVGGFSHWVRDGGATARPA